ncbi:hypothetical protein NEOLEDRAFT_1140164 [Neolentinus lepideus HHB14362 ss-1]|uniref:Uncharacterized protein n=1 Tax=Neolentinus lepideus HHB14362 ss-1 TaxID=1314782 RepID=A0A165PCS5_9AGAM|nr:hypothetical protein NEOLEDRAFT_1140164 [Neolentinus lepideus HHB14362 ss-1]
MLHYEHQHYGPDNTFLYSCFPSQRRFSVIPQAVIRKVRPILPNVNPLNISQGSTGSLGDIQSRPQVLWETQ